MHVGDMSENVRQYLAHCSLFVLLQSHL